MTVATIGHVARAVATSAHISDGSFDISRLFLLPPTIVTDYMTSGVRCYCRGTGSVATSPRSRDVHSDISDPSLLPPTVATDVQWPMLLAPQ
jgi:hypothetical protein